MNVGGISGESCHVGHSCVHISGANGVSHGFILLDNGFVCLTVFVRAAGVTTLVEEEFSLVEVFLVSGDQIKFGKCHFGNLMSGNTDLLPFACTYLTTYAIGVLDGDVEEVFLPGCLIVGDGTFHHVSQIIELMAQVFYLFPALASRPFVRMLRVHGAAGVEVAVGFLRGGHNHQHTVDVLSQFLVWVSLQQVAGAFNGFIDVRIVKGQSADFYRIAGMRCVDEVLISSCFLAFAESKRNGYFAACVEALPPKGVGYFYRSEGHRVNGVTVRLIFHLCLTAYCSGKHQSAY